MSSLSIVETEKSQRNVSGVDRRETGLLLRQKTTSLSRTMVFDPAPCAHLPGNELKFDCLSRLDLSLRKSCHSQISFFSSEVFFHCLSMQRFVSKRSSS